MLKKVNRIRPHGFRKYLEKYKLFEIKKCTHPLETSSKNWWVNKVWVVSVEKDLVLLGRRVTAQTRLSNAQILMSVI